MKNSTLRQLCDEELRHLFDKVAMEMARRDLGEDILNDPEFAEELQSSRMKYN
jgi:hypothetical protein